MKLKYQSCSSRLNKNKNKYHNVQIYMIEKHFDILVSMMSSGCNLITNLGYYIIDFNFTTI